MNNKNYVNYHTHKYYTNKTIHDSPTGYEEYIKRAIELGVLHFICDSLIILL